MRNLQNLHTHSNYCDGADTPEEVVLKAISKGFDSIGFSGHSYMHYSPSHSMSVEGTEEYKKTVRALAEKYKSEIEIFCGLEFDMLSKIDMTGYDYMIGSVHYFKIGEDYVGFDRSAEVVKKVIDEYFGGDGMAYAKAYYRDVARLPELGNFEILGHFDLISKHSDNVCFFDESSKEYLSAAYEAIDAVKGKIPFFEVNTGAIARGYRKTPYPCATLLKRFKERGFGAIISSDCHNADQLDCAFSEAAELLEACGFNERYILTKRGFEAVALR